MLKSTIIAALISINPNYCESKMADILKKIIDSGALEVPKPKPKPKSGCMNAIDKEMLRQVNFYRSRGATCGSKTKPLQWSCELAKASKAHANDMYRNNFMSHTGSDNSSMSTRVRRTNFSGRTLGENIAKGHSGVSIVMKAWMKSPGHCKNIMNPRFKYLGHSQMQRNWVQNFGG